MIRMSTRWIVGALALCMTAGAFADTGVSEQLKAMQAKMQAMEAQMAQMRADSDQNWLNERRAEEVKSLVKEVLADADTRASLLEGSMAAGHNGKNFFLASEDGSFSMAIAGHLQFRYIWQHQDETSDEDDSGFQFRRMKIKFKGHIGDPKITYGMTIVGSRDGANASFEGPYMGYNFGNGWDVQFGILKIPFLRQELTSSSKQLAVDRGLVTEYFTMNYSEMIKLNYKADNYRLSFSLNDGENADFSETDGDNVEIAVSARADVKLAGNWKQWSDTSAWTSDEMGLFVGAAVHYQAGDAANGTTSDYTAWTIDGSLENNGLGIFAAYMGGNIDPDGSSAASTTMQGFLVEAGYMVIPDTLEPFVRWEYLDYDSASLNEMQAITLGFNWYQKGHSAKFTTDVVWVYDGDIVSNPFGSNPGSDGLGMSNNAAPASASANDEEIIVLRAQYQLLF